MSVFTGIAVGENSGADLAELRRALEIFPDPEYGFQFFGLPGAHHYTRKGSDIDGIIKVVPRLVDCQFVFWRLNPVKLNQGSKSANVSDHTKRRWLLIDIDPIKPANHKDDPATDTEQAAAMELTLEVVAYLRSLGWPDPVIVSSGNGFHILYRIDLKNDEESRLLLRRLLENLGDKFSGPRGEIDEQVYSVTFNSRLPGFKNRKGKASAERPFRMVTIFHDPGIPSTVTREQLLVVAGTEKPKAPRAAQSVFVGRAASEGMPPYVKKAIEEELALLESAPDRGRDKQLIRSACAIGNFVPHYLSREEAYSLIYGAAKSTGLPDSELQSKVGRHIDRGMTTPRHVPPTPAATNGTAKKQEPKTVTIEPGKPLAICAKDIIPTKVKWLWPGRVPIGKMTVFAGPGGIGKTFVLCDIAARVSLGSVWPDNQAYIAPKGKVLFISGEDDPDDTLVPRLMKCGADLSQIFFYNFALYDHYSMQDLKAMDGLYDQIGEDLSLIVIDPPTSFLSGVDDHKNSELRAVLTPLKNWIFKHKVSLILNTHINKGGAGKVDAQMRVMGSVAWVNMVRVAHMFCDDPDDDEKKLYIPMKANLGRKKKGMVYRIPDLGDDEMSFVEWMGEADLTANEAMNKGTEKKKRSIGASQWLEEIFASTSLIGSKDIFTRQKKETTISRNALFEAKEEMGIKARQDADVDGNNYWVWYWSDLARNGWNQAKEKNDAERFE
jgi:putative DNA primase/helicase